MLGRDRVGDDGHARQRSRRRSQTSVGDVRARGRRASPPPSTPSSASAASGVVASTITCWRVEASAISPASAARRARVAVAEDVVEQDRRRVLAAEQARELEALDEVDELAGAEAEIVERDRRGALGPVHDDAEVGRDAHLAVTARRSRGRAPRRARGSGAGRRRGTSRPRPRRARRRRSTAPRAPARAARRDPRPRRAARPAATCRRAPPRACRTAPRGAAARTRASRARSAISLVGGRRGRARVGQHARGAQLHRLGAQRARRRARRAAPRARRRAVAWSPSSVWRSAARWRRVSIAAAAAGSSEGSTPMPQVRVAHAALGLDELAVEAPALGALARAAAGPRRAARSSAAVASSKRRRGWSPRGGSGRRRPARAGRCPPRRAAGCGAPRPRRRRAWPDGAVALEHQPVHADAARDERERRRARSPARAPTVAERATTATTASTAVASERGRRTARRHRWRSRGARRSRSSTFSSSRERGAVGPVAVGLVHRDGGVDLAQPALDLGERGLDGVGGAARALGPLGRGRARVAARFSSSTIADGLDRGRVGERRRAVRSSSPRLRLERGDAGDPLLDLGEPAAARGRARARQQRARPPRPLTVGLARCERRALDLLARLLGGDAAPRRRGGPRRVRAAAGACSSARCRSRRAAPPGSRRRGWPTRGARCSRAPTRARRATAPSSSAIAASSPWRTTRLRSKTAREMPCMSSRSTPSPAPRIAAVQSTAR